MLRPLATAATDAVKSLSAQVLELRGVHARLESARDALQRRVELWDADELAPKWAATASWLHPKDRNTAQLLERRQAAYKRADQLLKHANSLVHAASLPERAGALALLQSRCEDVRTALIPPTILMAEEVAVADELAALAFRFTSPHRHASITPSSETHGTPP